MWDTVELGLGLHREGEGEVEGYGWKARLLLSMGKQTMFHASIDRLAFPFDALLFMRVACLAEDDLDTVQLRIEEVRAGIAEETASLAQSNTKSSSGGHEGETPPRGVGPDASRKRNVGFECAKAALEPIVSLPSEVRALVALLRAIEKHKAGWPTSVEEDERALEALEDVEKRAETIALELDDNRENAAASENGGGDTDDNLWKAKSALHYRLTRKAIVDVNIKRLRRILQQLQLRYDGTLDALSGVGVSAYVDGSGSGATTAFDDNGDNGKGLVSSRQLFEELARAASTEEDKGSNLAGAGNESPYHSTAGSTRMGTFNKELNQETRLKSYLRHLYEFVER
jgi:hypothetical protein